MRSVLTGFAQSHKIVSPIVPSSIAVFYWFAFALFSGKWNRHRQHVIIDVQDQSWGHHSHPSSNSGHIDRTDRASVALATVRPSGVEYDDLTRFGSVVHPSFHGCGRTTFGLDPRKGYDEWRIFWQRRKRSFVVVQKDELNYLLVEITTGMDAALKWNQFQLNVHLVASENSVCLGPSVNRCADQTALHLVSPSGNPTVQGA
ncbi:hypothetical protein RHSIM_Rhsim08G0225900 [Rhododendron simsii]|uniref:Uncharacterized protein n=1 Tax=Rhododendron simsii TaxID=118357 RepID=A0A834GJ95_RHOSS|nr:hypothetical protein RHSIM_Rhsim08G0225900 [Rhododendron simsii]